MRATSGGFRQRPRAVWAALATGVVLSFIVVLAVLLPVLGLIAAADAGTAGFLDVPAGAITLSILVSYVLALVLLVLTFLSRNGALAWVLAVAAVIATLVGSVWPLFATAFASVEQGQQILPFIADLIGRATGN